MAKHSDIVKRAVKRHGSIEAVADWRDVSVHTVRSWLQRNSIPADHWFAFVDGNVSTFEELSQPDARGKAAA